MALAEQHASFQDRIARIQKGGANTAGKLVCGVSTTRAPKSKAERRARDRAERRQEKAMRRASVKQRKSPLLARILALPVALFCGGTAMLGGRIALFHLFPPGTTPRFELPDNLAAVLTGSNGELWAGAALAMTLALIFKLMNPVRMVALAAGFGAMMIGETRLAEQYPDVWSALYTPIPVVSAQASAPATTQTL